VIVRTFDTPVLASGVVFNSAQLLNGASSEDWYDFNLKADTTVIFSRGQFSPCHLWRLIDPQGQVQAGPVELCASLFTYTPKISRRHRLAVLDNALYVGGQFQFPGRNIGRWTDQKWSDSLVGGPTSRISKPAPSID
jgi:hypothetical protein